MKVLSARAKLFNRVFAYGITHQDLTDLAEDLTDWFPTSVVSTSIKHMSQNTYMLGLEYNLVWLQIYLYILSLNGRRYVFAGNHAGIDVPCM
jgi:hypothetical protein